ncbi:MAG: hypothetical protein U0231_14405 [Nitrospiraceae bacterium]
MVSVALPSIDFQTRQAAISKRVQGEGTKPTIEVEQFKGGDEEPRGWSWSRLWVRWRQGSRPVVSGEDGAAALELAHRILAAIGAACSGRRTATFRLPAALPVRSAT